jgi:cytochrome c oxidase subunit I+III
MPPMTSIWRWLTTTNHKDIGILYVLTSLFFFIAGGTMALLIRLQLWTGGELLSGGAFNEAVSAHGLLMVFFFISPFAFGFANYVVPLQIGAKDLAFPRLNALSYWMYLFSGILFMVSFFQGDGTFAGGWTMYAPLSTPAFMPSVGAVTAVLALIMFVISVTVSSVNFLTTMHSMRAEDMRMRDMPFFSWSILLTVWMMLFAFAALLAAWMILAADQILGTNYYTTTVSGAGSLLWTHLWWFFGHPEVYIVFFPALGMMAEIFQTFSGKRLVGRKWFIGAMILVAVQSFMVWMHHMFLTGINLETQTVFMATTIGISLPFDLMTFALIYTLVKGKIRFTTPFLFAFGGLFLFIIGGITGVFLGAIPLDYNLRGTYWVVAHFHYVMFGGGTAMIGGLYYWYPKMAGRMYDEFLGKIHFALFFVGFNLLYFSQFVVWRTPRRVFNFPPEYLVGHRVSTIGGFLLGGSMLIMIYNLVKSLRHGEEAGENPWEGSTIEWAVPSPPPFESFGGGKPSFSTGSLEIVGGGEEAATDGGHAHEEEHADHASIWPFAISVAFFLFLLGLSGLDQGGFYPALTALGGVATLLTVFQFTRESFHAPLDPLAEKWPFEDVEQTKLGMWIFLASDIVIFGAFIGSFIFLRFAYGWEAWHHDLVPTEHTTIPGLVNTYLLLTSSFAVVLAMVAAKKEKLHATVAALLATLLLGIGFLVNKAIEWDHLFHLSTEHFANGWTFTTNAASSTFYLTTGLHGAHVTIGLLITVWMIYRAWGGAYQGEDEPIEYFGLYWHFVDIVWLFLFPLFYII